MPRKGGVAGRPRFAPGSAPSAGVARPPAARSRSPRLSVPALLPALLLLAAAGTRPAAAQLPYRPALPWAEVTAGSPRNAIHFEADLFADPGRNWRAQRLGFTGAIARGGGVLFLRLPWCALDTGGLPARERWPDLIVAGADTLWPHENQTAGWGSPEVGWLGPVKLPGLGPSHFGLAATLPAGENALYPFASTAFPVTFQLRRALNLGAGWSLALHGGPTIMLGRGRPWMSRSAHPSTTLAGVTFGWQPSARRALQAALEEERGDGRRSSRVSLLWRIPAGPQQSLSLLAQRELGGGGDRAFATRWAVAWSVRGDAVAGPPDGVAK